MTYEGQRSGTCTISRKVNRVFHSITRNTLNSQTWNLTKTTFNEGEGYYDLVGEM